MRIILIGNYAPDQQESMERFAQMLASGLQNAGHEAEIWRPSIYVGRWNKSTNSGLGKWVGYVDKLIIFPLILKWRLLDNNLNNLSVWFHICDHSNSPYLKYLPSQRTSITCHDVLAIRGALGHKDTYCQASALGEIMQKWILKWLSQAKQLASVSNYSLNQLKELTSSQDTSSENWQVIYNSFNADFYSVNAEQISARIYKKCPGLEGPFLLHVGSGHIRKNRKMLLRMVDVLGERWQGNICFAGEALDKEILSLAQSLGLIHRVISFVKPTHAELLALYSACEAFVFPSYSEGFGWPIIEAQACSAPVITSNIEPMLEISGGAALYANPDKPEDFAEALFLLKDYSVREGLIKNGLSNIRRFESKKMIDSYLNLYGIESVAC
jgi:glycosyltransferase involved in cell wall biosynthesis